MSRKIFIIIFCFITLQISVLGQNIDSLEQQLTKVQNIEKIDLLNQLSEEYCYEGDYQKARNFADEALYLATEINYIKGLADAFMNIAEYFYEVEIFDNSADYYLKAFEKYELLEEKENMSYCTNVAGICYRKIFEYDKSIEYHLQSLRIAEEIENDYRISAAIYSLGVLYHGMNEFDKALEYYNQSLEFDIKNNDSLGIAKSYTNIGIIYRHLNNFETSKDFYNKSLDLYQKLKDTTGIAIVVNNLGILYLDNKEFQEALTCFEKSIFYEKQNKNTEGIASSLSSVGDTYLVMNELDSALKYQFLGIELTNDPDLKKYIYESLTKIYSQKADYKNALIYHELYATQKDTLFKLENLKQIANMQTKYDTEKKEKEILELITQKKIQEVSLKKNRIIIYVTIGGLILFFILIVVVLSAYRLKQRANNLLAYQNAQILQQKEEIITQRDEIEIQKQEIEIKHKQITASINYAKRIQEAVLPKKAFIELVLHEHFIFFKPRDIVSGDFYFIKQIKNYTLIAAADCTGHGVPGAFMNMLGVALLNELVRNSEIQTPAQLLNELRNQIKSSLQQIGQKTEQQDGMDIAFCSINNETLEMYFAGANNPCWIFRKELKVENELDEKKLLTHDFKLITLEADQQPVGIYLKENPFTENKFQLQKDDIIYLFSDGYTSQFGGEKNEKFKTKRFKELLSEICNLPLTEQKQILENKFIEWKGNQEQTDDVLVVSVKI
jgi:serine phosphatase RsbU (regulator of sigma subunit)